jgi:hypothetical protein
VCGLDRIGLAVLLVTTGIAASACSRHSGADRAPSICTGGLASARVSELRTALAKAPGPVALPDGTRISDCLAHDADSGDLETVGSTMLSVVQTLAVGAHAGPNGPAATQLGYLIGAAHRGAAEAQGVADELVRRLDQELQDVDVSSRAYRAGEHAGRASG